MTGRDILFGMSKRTLITVYSNYLTGLKYQRLDASCVFYRLNASLSLNCWLHQVCILFADLLQVVETPCIKPVENVHIGLMIAWQQAWNACACHAAPARPHFTSSHHATCCATLQENIEIHCITLFTSLYSLHLISLDDFLHSYSAIRAFSEPHYLIKGNVYELTALMLEKEKNDHLRVGVTFPNGTFVGPIKNRIFISKYGFAELSAKNLASIYGFVRHFP